MLFYSMEKIKYKLEISYIYRTCQIFSGVAVLLYLLFHFSVMTALFLGEDLFSSLINFYNHWFFVLIERGAMVGILFHILNGLRMIAISFGLWINEDEDMIRAVLIGTVILSIIHTALPYFRGAL